MYYYVGHGICVTACTFVTFVKGRLKFIRTVKRLISLIALTARLTFLIAR